MWIFSRRPRLVSEGKFIFIVVRKDIQGFMKLHWTPLWSCWWIIVCLQSLSWPRTPGKMRGWNVSPHVAKSNTTHSGTQEDSHLGLKTAQQEIKAHKPHKAKHIGLKKSTVESAENRRIPHLTLANLSDYDLVHQWVKKKKKTMSMP